MSKLRLRFVPLRRLSKSHKIGVAVGVLLVVVGILGLVLGWGS